MFVERAETGSTNDDARELALAGAPHGACVLAARQNAGRGRAGRSFLSPEGGMYLSVVLRPRAPPHHWSLLPLASGAAAAVVLRGLGFPAEVKWPNDVLLAGRKVGGILVESRMGKEPFAVVGVGMNLSAVPAGVAHATALGAHGGAPGARPLAERVRDRLLSRVARLDERGPAALLPEIRALCATLGRNVEWEKGEGVAVDLAEDGALVVMTGGERVHVVAGDVRLRYR